MIALTQNVVGVGLTLHTYLHLVYVDVHPCVLISPLDPSLLPIPPVDLVGIRDIDQGLLVCYVCLFEDADPVVAVENGASHWSNSGRPKLIIPAAWVNGHQDHSVTLIRRPKVLESQEFLCQLNFS